MAYPGESRVCEILIILVVFMRAQKVTLKFVVVVAVSSRKKNKPNQFHDPHHVEFNIIPTTLKLHSFYTTSCIRVFRYLENKILDIFSARDENFLHKLIK